MQEGILVWHEDSIAVQYFSHGDLIFAPLKAGQTVELFQNGYWHKVKIASATEEPYIENWNYGNCLGSDIKVESDKL